MASPRSPRDRRRPPGPRPGPGLVGRPGSTGGARGAERGLLYEPGYLRPADRADILAWLATLRPLWEQRYSTRRPPPAGKQQRPLLRPVYWLGNWQFACLGYYEPPRRTRDCAVAAEPFPPVLARLVADIEPRVRRSCAAADVPRGWHLNTCLVNFYGDRQDGTRWVDVARVGDHRDFEPGPVASLSIGERALFQFVRRGAAGQPPVRGQWLDDGSLQAFAGPWWKDELLHRVQRVDDKHQLDLPPAIDGFRTRRVNLTFRYVPPADVVPLAALGDEAYADVHDYVATLAASSPHFAAALAAPRRRPDPRRADAVTGTPAPRPPPNRRTSWSGTRRR
ncbi:MAG: alpha-ketoglutarate-dependent dioxygenase AlkB [Kofleriaceae bacterium]|jgi:alkylated DNA repair protein (DNA oxidative demethylase)|nr:alpha-ketoglutarate-dependent dioxygenase AlkB [Kofleriaceae bacterium]MBP9204362.1 alpha-ketoglutarate-dependent dioxygenase AlkB [Kofleriaceae bacterium]